MFEQLNADFHAVCRAEGLNYQLIPYFISSHPGCTEADMRALSQKVLGKLHFTLEQVQDLTPTPMTLSSVMFYTGTDPYTGAPLYVARNQDDKRRQKSYFFREEQRSSRPQSSRSQSSRSPKGAPTRPSNGTPTRQPKGTPSRSPKPNAPRRKR
jgi:radical SAM superfamily enzyme YgiQ (UPF0313 family)